MFPHQLANKTLSILSKHGLTEKEKRQVLKIVRGKIELAKRDKELNTPHQQLNLF